MHLENTTQYTLYYALTVHDSLNCGGRTDSYVEKVLFHVDKILAYSTEYSQVVTYPSTNSARCCLTSVIRRELVFSTWYGRRHYTWVQVAI